MLFRFFKKYFYNMVSIEEWNEQFQLLKHSAQLQLREPKIASLQKDRFSQKVT